MTPLDQSYFGAVISDPVQIKQIHDLASQWQSSPRPCVPGDSIRRADVMSWIATGVIPRACMDNFMCAAAVSAQAYAANKTGFFAMTPQRYASLTGGAADDPDPSIIRGNPLSSPQAAVFYWRLLAGKGMWLATSDGAFPCPATCYSPGCSVPFTGFIQASDILSAMAPDWTGLYKPLPAAFQSQQVVASGIAGPSPTAAQIADNILQSVGGQQTQQLQAATAMQQSGTPQAGLPWIPIAVAVVVLILILRG